jgi:Phage tail tube protein
VANRIAGIAFVRTDGNQLPLRGNFTVSPSAVERTGIAGLDEVHGYAEVPRIPFIEGDISLDPALSTEDMEAITNSTVTAELANGHTYVLRESWCKAAFELNARDGLVRVRWEGKQCDEITP